jgi:DMSO/TMAO reductase YedYZ molybdopterin-dependent catalytic subunit
MDLDRARIFRMLETADNFLKYAKPSDRQRAADRARDRYRGALKLAEQKADPVLIEQVRLRLDDLERASAEPPLPVEKPWSAPQADPEPSSDYASRLPQLIAQPQRTGRRVPPGQRVTQGWPVLHEGPIPAFDKKLWRLRVQGACKHPFELTYDEVRAFPNLEVRSDFHCVTGWSKLDNVWRGVQTKLLVQHGQASAEASHVLVHGENGYTANVSLDVLLDDTTLVTWSHNSQDLAAEHGYPLRLLVPGLYGWKSVKWIVGFELLTHDRRGFWETRGYHNHADPWREERYAYQEG